MKIFLIGDVHGCYRELSALLDQMAPAHDDEIWFCGDLVGRGPQPEEVMRLICALPGARGVLGNHDLHLLSIAAGVRDNKSSLRLDSLLRSPALGDYIDWLRQRPLALSMRNIILVHASVHPLWDEEKIMSLSRQASAKMLLPGYAATLAGMYGNQPARWHEGLQGEEKWRLLLNIFTRARYFHPDGHVNLDRDNRPDTPGASDDIVPWYELAHARGPQTLVFFGHWSALADYNIDAGYRVYHLDKGCVWGNRLFGAEVSWETAPARPVRGASDGQSKLTADSSSPCQPKMKIRTHCVKAFAAPAG